MILKQKSAQHNRKSITCRLKPKNFWKLKAQVDSKQNLYKFLQSKREETAISRASTISNSKVVDNAVPSLFPIKPNVMPFSY